MPGAPLPDKADASRSLLPLITNAYEAGKRAGRIEHEHHTRHLLRWWFGQAADLLTGDDVEARLCDEDCLAEVLAIASGYNRDPHRAQPWVATRVAG